MAARKKKPTLVCEVYEQFFGTMATTGIEPDFAISRYFALRPSLI